MKISNINTYSAKQIHMKNFENKVSELRGGSAPATVA